MADNNLKIYVCDSYGKFSPVLSFFCLNLCLNKNCRIHSKNTFLYTFLYFSKETKVIISNIRSSTQVIKHDQTPLQLQMHCSLASCANSLMHHKPQLDEPFSSFSQSQRGIAAEQESGNKKGDDSHMLKTRDTWLTSGSRLCLRPDVQYRPHWTLSLVESMSSMSTSCFPRFISRFLLWICPQWRSDFHTTLA